MAGLASTPEHVTIRCAVCRHWVGEDSRDQKSRRCMLKGGVFFGVLQTPSEYCLKAEAGPNTRKENSSE